MAMPFGKHKGTTLDRLPFDYVCWLYKWEHVRQDMKDELRRCAIEVHAAPYDWNGEESSSCDYDPDTDFNDGWGSMRPRDWGDL